MHVALCVIESVSIFGCNSVNRSEASLITIIQFVFVEVVLHEAVDVHWPFTHSSLSALNIPVPRRGKLSLTKIKSILLHHLIIVFYLRILRERFMTQKRCRVVNSGHFFERAYLLERLSLHLTVI